MPPKPQTTHHVVCCCCGGTDTSAVEMGGGFPNASSMDGSGVSRGEPLTPAAVAPLSPCGTSVAAAVVTAAGWLPVSDAMPPAVVEHCPVGVICTAAAVVVSACVVVAVVLVTAADAADCTLLVAAAAGVGVLNSSDH